MVPPWLRILSIAYVTVAVVCFFIVLYDIFGAGHRHKMKVMEAVWPVTMLYAGPIGLYIYWEMGRTRRPEHARTTAQGKRTVEQKRPFWQSVILSTSHCGAGCTLGDITGEWIVFLAGISILGTTLYANYAFDYAFAYTLGIVFQYFAIKPMHKEWTCAQGLKRAVQADTLSLTAFEVGLFSWMAVTHYYLFQPPLETDLITYWFMMWVGMMLGFLTSYPANWWLVKRGLKERM